MTRKDQIKKIYNFIHSEHICVTATVTPEGKPEAATLSFSETPDLKIIFQTPSSSRKYGNLMKNKSVAVVIGWDLKKFVTVQYEGEAEEVGDADLDWVRDLHTGKNKESKRYAYIKENKYFLVKPRWIRFWDVLGNVKFELTY